MAYTVISGLKVDIDKSNVDSTYFYITGGQINDTLDNTIFSLLPVKINKILKSNNHIYFSLVSKKFIVCTTTISDIYFPGIYLGVYYVEANGYISDYTIATNQTTEIINPLETVLLSLTGSVELITDEDLIVTNNQVTLTKIPAEIMSIYVLGEGDLDNPNLAIVSIDNNVLTFISALDGKQLDIIYQAAL